MKKIHNLLTVLAIAAVSLAVTSCYDSWRDRYYTYWDYDYGYHGRSWDYNRDSYYHPGNYSDYNEAYDLADALRGEWEGFVTYQYTDDDNQKAQVEFGAKFRFDQFSGTGTSLSGTGVETDYDNEGNTQTLQFAWYVDEQTSDIYIRYTETGKTFVMDIDSENYGFFLDTGKGIFYGYAFGTNTTDMLFLDLQRPQSLKAKADGAGSAANDKQFGSKTVAKAPVSGPVQKKLLKR